jgi:hypothetical protein
VEKPTCRSCKCYICSKFQKHNYRQYSDCLLFFFSIVSIIVVIDILIVIVLCRYFSVHGSMEDNI